MLESRRAAEYYPNNFESCTTWSHMRGQRFTFEHVAVGRRGILILAALLKRQGEIVTKAELMDAAWPGTAAEESNLSVQIALLRKAIGLTADGEEWISTIPRIGYRILSACPASEGSVDEVSPKPSLAVLPFANLSNDPE
jgi:DNA-binding winged helix-turn-helix (wHTH) protein